MTWPFPQTKDDPWLLERLIRKKHYWGEKEDLKNNVIRIKKYKFPGCGFWPLESLAWTFSRFFCFMMDLVRSILP